MILAFPCHQPTIRRVCVCLAEDGDAEVVLARHGGKDRIGVGQDREIAQPTAAGLLEHDHVGRFAVDEAEQRGGVAVAGENVRLQDPELTHGVPCVYGDLLRGRQAE
jgi:hypothetical protein